jgi:hypothetical protein
MRLSRCGGLRRRALSHVKLAGNHLARARRKGSGLFGKSAPEINQFNSTPTGYYRGLSRGPVKMDRAASSSVSDARSSEIVNKCPTTNQTAPSLAEATLIDSKPAAVGEKKGEIEFRVVNNDGTRESTVILTGLKNLFQKHLPIMPKAYIARLVYNPTHLSLAIVKMLRS